MRNTKNNKLYFLTLFLILFLISCGGGTAISGFDINNNDSKEEDILKSDIFDAQDAKNQDKKPTDIELDSSSKDFNEGIDRDVEKEDTQIDTDIQKDGEVTDSIDSDINVITCKEDADCADAFDDLGVCEQSLCKEGKCVKTAKQCNRPPADECKDDKTLITYQKDGTCDENTGECVYPQEEVECRIGCVNGKCIGEIGLLDADFIPAGPVIMSGGDYTLRASLTTWYEGVEVSNDTTVLIP